MKRELLTISGSRFKRLVNVLHMKSLLFRFLIAATITGLAMTMSSPRLAAQTPEFRLDLTLTDTNVVYRNGTIIERDTITLAGSAFGFDANARDGYDAVFGEDDLYPESFSQLGYYGNSLYFEYPNADTTTRVTIRHKPNVNSFSLDYAMGLWFNKGEPGAIHWNKNLIPQAVNAIWLRPLNRLDTVLVDMKKFSELQNDSLNQKWGGEYLITVFYNMTPSLLDVPVSPVAQGGLILSALAYPNPVVTVGKLALDLAEPAMVSIAGYDATGRKCLSLVRQSSSGTQLIDLGAITAAQGAIFLHVDATSATRHETRNMMIVKE